MLKTGTSGAINTAGNLQTIIQTRMSIETIGVYDAKTHLTRLLNEVGKGKMFTITRHGVPVAVLSAPPARPRPNSAAAIEEWRAYRATHMDAGSDFDIRAAVEEGRR